MIRLLPNISLMFFLAFVSTQTGCPVQNKTLVYADDFSSRSLSANWVVEQNGKEKNVCTVVEGGLQFNSDAGVTAWYKYELAGDILIEYDRAVMVDSGVHDRLSDLNQFWMATDPQQKLFTRKGGFREYDSLRMYYVGMGSNYNTTTRMRRYDGKGNLQIVGEYTDSLHLLTANRIYHVEIAVRKGTSSFTVNGKTFFTYTDPQPLTHGWFALRSTRSRQVIDNLKIWKLN